MRRKGYTVFSIVTGLAGEAALAAIVLWLLPRWEVNIPIWGLIALMVAYEVYEGISYRIGSRALGKKSVVSLEARSAAVVRQPHHLLPMAMSKFRASCGEHCQLGQT